MSSATLLTVEQFEQLPVKEGVRYELKDGELIEMALAKFGHEQTKARAGKILTAYLLQHPLGDAYPETAFALTPSCVRVPDVAFLSNESAAKGDPDHIFRGAPELAIEVVSESESALDLRQKIQEYLDAGCKAVWTVYPTVRVVAVYDQTGVKELRGKQVLDAPGILPGFQTPADQFFA
jgi:Uma2 family endonuclease